MPIDPVILQLRADVADYRRKVDQAEKASTRTFGEIERKSGVMAGGVRKSFSAAGQAALVFAGGIASIATAREFLRLADSAKQLEAQLTLATRESGSFAQAQDDVRRIAGESRTSLEATAQLYSTFQRNALDLGITQEQAARATETVTKAFQISGATAAEAAGGVRQFLQGLQSGALRGEELNSVLENAPRLAKLLADSLGITVGQLRALGQEGDLAADKLIRALTDRKFTAGIDAEFKELPVTFDQAMQQVENAAIITFGAFDRGGQFSSAIATFITDGTSGFADLETAAENFGRTVASEFAGIAEVGNQVIGVLQGIQSALQWIDGNTGGILGRAASWAQNSGLAYGPAGVVVQAIRKTPQYQNATGNRERQLRLESGEQWLRQRFQGMDVFGNPIASSRPRAVTPPSTKPSRKTGGRGGGGPSEETLARRAEQDRIRAIRDDAANARDIASLDDDIAAAKGALARSAEDLLAFELGQVDRQRDAALARYETELKIGDLTNEEYQERAAKVEEASRLRKQGILLEKAERDVAQATRDSAELEDQRHQQRVEALRLQFDLADTEAERRNIALQILDADDAYLRSKLEAAALSKDLAEAERARLALAELDRTAPLRRANVERDFEGPLARYARDAKDANARVEEAAARRIADLNDTIADTMSKALGVKDPFLRDLLRIFLDQNVFGPLAQALSGAGGGGGGLLGSIVTTLGAFFGGGRASGGRVNAGTMYRINEGASPGRVEGFVPQGSGDIIPLGRMNSVRGGGGMDGQVTVRLMLSDDIDARIDQRSAGVAVEVVRAAAPGIVRSSVGETMRQANRPRL